MHNATKLLFFNERLWPVSLDSRVHNMFIVEVNQLRPYYTPLLGTYLEDISSKEYILAAFIDIDIEGAFNNVTISSIEEALESKNFCVGKSQ